MAPARSALVAVKRSACLCCLIAMIASEGGCHKKKMSAQACQRETASLVALFRSVDSGPPLVRPDKIELVQRPAVPATMARPSFTVYVSPQEMRLDNAGGTKVLTIDTLPDEVQQWRDSSTASPAEQVPVLVFDRATPWRIVAKLSQLLNAAGFAQIGFAFAAPPKPLVSQPPSSVDVELDAILRDEPSERATKLAKLVGGIVATCPQLQHTFASVSNSNEDKAVTIGRAIEQSLPQCDCNIDLAALRAVMVRVLHNPNPTFAIVKRVDPNGQTLSQPAAQRWSESNTLIVAGDQTIWLRE